MSEDSRPSFVYYAWQIFFALMYPILVTFSLIFTGILLLFSGLSRLLIAVASFFAKKKPAPPLEPTPTIETPHV